MENRAKSVKYVNGDRDATTTPQLDIFSNGMKIPLTKITGNFTNVDSIMMSDTKFVGCEEKSKPRHEKQNADRSTAMAKISGVFTQTPIATPTAMGTAEMHAPKMKEAIISPNIIVLTVMGQEMSRSSVLICVSHGAITGETEVDVKNMVIATNPGMRNAAGKSRPMEKARNRKRGNKMPNNRTGPLK